jgi:heterotetrameric sarcosine oxidase delta subunit
MAFLLNCPNCGERNVQEFRFGGELSARPAPDATRDEWSNYYYFRTNAAGVQREWWNHRFGCRKWFLALRDTVTNRVQETSWP